MPRCTFCMETIDSLEEAEIQVYHALGYLMGAHENLRLMEMNEKKNPSPVTGPWADVDMSITLLMELCRKMGWYSMPNDRREAGSE